MQEARRVPNRVMEDLPDPGTVRQVVPGVLWVRMPLPFALNHVNVWLLEGEDGWTIVDTGIGGNRTKDLWERVFRESLGGKPVVRVIATHFHPDHVGLAGWLVERWTAEFCTSLTEWLFGRMLSLESPEAMVRTGLAFYRRAGLDEAALAVMAERGNSYAKGVTPLPTRLRRLKAGDRLAIGGYDWHVITGGGHTPEHVCLHCPDRNLFIAGDQVLPRISPNISVWASEPDADPLDDFLRTLDRLRGLPDDLQVLPSHDTPFTGLHARLDALSAHHRDRLEEVVKACAEPSTVAQVTRVMFNRPLDPHQLVFAIGEALAHLNHLAVRGRLIRRTDGDGLLRFSRP